MSDEEKRLSECLMFLANFNQARTQSILAKEKEKKDHNRNLNVPRKPPERRIGHFDTEAMGPEAFDLMFAFNPPGYPCNSGSTTPRTTFFKCVFKGLTLERHFTIGHN